MVSSKSQIKWLKRFQSYQFMQINPDSSGCTAKRLSVERFNRINSCRSIPTWDCVIPSSPPIDWFQSYQFMQINPDKMDGKYFVKIKVNSFNRINSCRSIPTEEEVIDYLTPSDLFQSYQFMQINPDSVWILILQWMKQKFQSYQFMQINPDLTMWMQHYAKILYMFQSYQFMQINPDMFNFLTTLTNALEHVSIVSIHADQSRLG